ncbi:MAG: hypothetical protein ACRD3Q_20150 [Terriglobales bacterium]
MFQPDHNANAKTRAAYDTKLTALAGTITSLNVDVLAVQGVGEPNALADLVERLDGTWHTALADPDSCGIRAGVISRFPFTATEQVVDFSDKLQPVQVDNTGTTMTHMGRPALHTTIDINGAPLNLISCHLKSKLLTFPGGRFSPHDEHERARFATYALHRRAAETAAMRLRHQLSPRKRAHTSPRRSRQSQRRTRSSDNPDPLRPAPRRNRNIRPQTPRHRRRPTPLGPRTPYPRGPTVYPHLSRTRRTHRPYPRLARTT